jgi:hypothetical protein
MKKKFLIGMAVLLSASLFFLGCGGDDDGEDNPGPSASKAKSLALTFDKPVTGQPAATEIDADEYTGSIAWKHGADFAETLGAGANFAASTVYKAVITLTAKDGYTFDGVAANDFTHADAESIDNPEGTGTTIMVNVVFPITLLAGGGKNPVDATDLTELAIRPVKNAAPVTSVEKTQYSASVAWKDDADAPYTANFAPNAIYTAVVTLTANPAYTFAGVTAGTTLFSCTGASSVTNAAVTEGKVVVTIVFQATEGTEDDPTIVTAVELKDSITAPVTGGTPDAAFTITGAQTGQFTAGNVSWKTGGTAAGDTFEGNAVYTAEVTLTPAQNYTFAEAEDFEYDGATVTQTAVGDDKKVTVTVTFGVTDTVVSEVELANAITAPKTGIEPDAEFASPDDEQYTGGAVTWTNNANVAVEDGTKFEVGTVYKATVTLTAEAGYTFATAEDFTYDKLGVTQTVNADGTVTVIVTFGQTTAAVGGTTVNVGVKQTITVTPSAGSLEDLTITKDGDSVTLTVANADEFTNITWYLDAGETAAATNVATYELDPDNLKVSKHTVTVTGTKDGKLYSEQVPFMVEAAGDL